MTQLEKDQKLIDINTQLQMLEDQKRALEATPVQKEFRVWEPDGNECWDAVGLHNYFNSEDDLDKLAVKAGMCHPKPETAQRHHEFLVMLHDLNKFAVEHNEGWKPDYSNPNKESSFFIIINSDGRLGVEKAYHPYTPSVLPHFQTYKFADKAIDTFGDRLKILFEYYNS
jgi:hypothetical protein